MKIETKENKNDYWNKCCIKHNHKEHEIDVINNIRYLLLDRLGESFWNLKPVFQQYVKLKSDQYAFIDLYFPALNIGIEVNELHHVRQEEDDFQRRKNLQNRLSALQDKSYCEIPVPIYNSENKTSVDEQQEKILYAVEQIVNKYHSLKEKPCWIDVDAVSYYENKSEMTINDDVSFYSHAEVANVVARTREYTLLQKVGGCLRKGRFDYDKYRLLILDNHSKNNRKTRKGYQNIFSEDGSTITMYTPNDKKSKESSFENKYIVFIHDKDEIKGEYRWFMGVFRKTSEEIDKGTRNIIVKYERESKSFPLEKMSV